MARKKIDHKRFLELYDRLPQKLAGSGHFTPEEILILQEHGWWFKNYIDDKKKASNSRVKPGRKPQPDAEIQPESLRRRELRKK